MPNTGEIGYVDYVLWGDDGLPLAVVEAKKTLVDAKVGNIRHFYMQNVCRRNSASDRLFFIPTVLKPGYGMTLTIRSVRFKGFIPGRNCSCWLTGALKRN